MALGGLKKRLSRFVESVVPDSVEDAFSRVFRQSQQTASERFSVGLPPSGGVQAGAILPQEVVQEYVRTRQEVIDALNQDAGTGPSGSSGGGGFGGAGSFGGFFEPPPPPPPPRLPANLPNFINPADAIAARIRARSDLSLPFQEFLLRQSLPLLVDVAVASGRLEPGTLESGRGEAFVNTLLQDFLSTGERTSQQARTAVLERSATTPEEALRPARLAFLEDFARRNMTPEEFERARTEIERATGQSYLQGWLDAALGRVF